LNREKEALELALAEAIQRLFRQRSERYLNDPISYGWIWAARTMPPMRRRVWPRRFKKRPAVQAHTRRRHVSKPRSEALPSHLPRYEVEAPAPEGVKHCRSTASDPDRLRHGGEA